MKSCEECSDWGRKLYWLLMGNCFLIINKSENMKKWRKFFKFLYSNVKNLKTTIFSVLFFYNFLEHFFPISLCKCSNNFHSRSFIGSNFSFAKPNVQRGTNYNISHFSRQIKFHLEIQVKLLVFLSHLFERYWRKKKRKLLKKAAI